MRAAHPALASLAWATLAQAEIPPSEADVAALLAALESRGCLIVNYNDYAILQDSKLDAEVANAAMRKLVAKKTITFEGDGLRLNTPECRTALPKAAPDRAAFVALLEAHGCKMTNAEANTLLPEAGFTPKITRPIVEGLVAEGLAEVDETRFTLKTGTCQ